MLTNAILLLLGDSSLERPRKTNEQTEVIGQIMVT